MDSYVYIKTDIRYIKCISLTTLIKIGKEWTFDTKSFI